MDVTMIQQIQKQKKNRKFCLNFSSHFSCHQELKIKCLQEGLQVLQKRGLKTSMRELSFLSSLQVTSMPLVLIKATAYGECAPVAGDTQIYLCAQLICPLSRADDSGQSFKFCYFFYKYFAQINYNGSTLMGNQNGKCSVFFD